MIRIPPAFPDRGRASMKRSILLFAILTGVGVACKKGDKVPAYVEIPAITLNASDSQGGTSAKITDAWVYADEELIGVYEIPARIPILREGTSTLMVQPAVKRNGMYDDRVRYPFYTTWTGTVDMVPTNTATLQPVVQYVSQASFWIEGFEDAGTNVEVTAASDTTLLLPTAAEYPDLVAYGNGCGGFVLDQAHPYLRLHTTVDFPSSSGAVYLELDHRNSIRFTVGLMFNAGSGLQAIPHVHIEPTGSGDGERWNKVYLDLTSSFNQNLSQRNIYIEASLPADMTQGAVYLDNIKVVRFQP
jgi:hypothetical protein